MSSQTEFYTVYAACGYDPQMLLSDQRTSMQKFIAGATLGVAYEPTKLYPFQEEMIKALYPNAGFHEGGVVRPKDGLIFPKGRMVIPVDVSQVESRVVRQACPRIETFQMKVGVDASGFRRGLSEVSKLAKKHRARIDEYIKQQLRWKRAWQEIAFVKALYDPTFESFPVPSNPKRLRYGLRLILSNDPRRRKRGKRICDQLWDEYQKGAK